MVTQGLVAYYNFNDALNLGYDGSGYDNQGVVYDGVSFSESGFEGGAALFGGYFNPGVIHVPHSSALSFVDGFTFSYHVKLTDSGGMNGWGYYSGPDASEHIGVFAVLAKSSDWSGFSTLMTGGSLWLGGPAQPGLGFAPDGSEINFLDWNHVAYTYSHVHQTIKTYLNGVLVQEVKEFTIDLAQVNQNDLFIGRFSEYWYPLNGSLPESVTLRTRKVMFLH